MSSAVVSEAPLPEWVDRDAMCRVCLCPNPVAKWSLFECTIVGRSIAEILNEVAGISVQQGDNYPTVCCSGCVKQVEVAQRLREQCQESERRLGKIFEKLQGMALERVVKQEQVDIKEEPEDYVMEEESVVTGNVEVEAPLHIAAIHGLMQPEEVAPMAVENPSSTVISNFNVDGLEIRIEVPGLENILQQNVVPEPTPEVTSHDKSAPPISIECCGCPLTFPTEEKFEAHVQEVHEPHRPPLHSRRKTPPYECFRCYKLVGILKNHHMRGNFCKICSKYVVDSRHYKTVHSVHDNPQIDRKYECCGCPLVFKTEAEFKDHVEIIHKPRRTAHLKPGQTECYRCLKPVVKLKEHHMRFQYCKICSQQFSDERAAKVHYRHKHKVYNGNAARESKICCGCAAPFKKIGDLKLHSNQVHYQHRAAFNPERPFQCEICFENYRNYDELHEHQTRYQKNNKPHLCGHCERSFFFLNSLRDHEKSHKSSANESPSKGENSKG